MSNLPPSKSEKTNKTCQETTENVMKTMIDCLENFLRKQSEKNPRNAIKLSNADLLKMKEKQQELSSREKIQEESFQSTSDYVPSTTNIPNDESTENKKVALKRSVTGEMKLVSSSQKQNSVENLFSQLSISENNTDSLAGKTKLMTREMKKKAKNLLKKFNAEFPIENQNFLELATVESITKESQVAILEKIFNFTIRDKTPPYQEYYSYIDLDITKENVDRGKKVLDLILYLDSEKGNEEFDTSEFHMLFSILFELKSQHALMWEALMIRYTLTITKSSFQKIHTFKKYLAERIKTNQESKIAYSKISNEMLIYSQDVVNKMIRMYFGAVKLLKLCLLEEQ